MNIEQITRKHTGFTSFSELLGAPGNYFPTVLLTGKSIADQVECHVLIEAYDYAQQLRGDERRAFTPDSRREIK